MSHDFSLYGFFNIPLQALFLECVTAQLLRLEEFTLWLCPIEWKANWRPSTPSSRLPKTYRRPARPAGCIRSCPMVSVCPGPFISKRNPVDNVFAFYCKVLMWICARRCRRPNPVWMVSRRTLTARKSRPSHLKKVRCALLSFEQASMELCSSRCCFAAVLLRNYT